MLIEALAATLVLSVGLVGMLTGFVTSQKLSVMSEKQSSMSHVAQREIERVEGLPYASVALSTTPVFAAAPSPDANVTAVTVNGVAVPAYRWNGTLSAPEPLLVDATNGVVTAVQNWTEGGLSGSLWDFVTSSTDASCSPGCPASGDYKRVTVVVTVNGPNPPSPVSVSTLIANPDAAPAQGVVNGTAGNPISSGSTTCATVSGTTTTQGPCESPIDAGVPNTFFLHDCPATGTGCAAPSAAHALHTTVGTLSGLTCKTTLSSLSGVAATAISGCPVPDRMDATMPAASGAPVQYSTDLATTGYSAGRLLQPLCASGQLCGSAQASDCNNGVAWGAGLLSSQNELWTTPPLSTATTLTGEGALNLFTQTQNGTGAVVTLCLEIYDIPPSGGVAGSLADLLAWPPTALGGAGFVAATDPSTSSNWPTSPTNVEYEFHYASGSVTVPAGDRIGLRVWMVANVNNAIALLYDNAQAPSELQLNSQSAIGLSAS